MPRLDPLGNWAEKSDTFTGLLGLLIVKIEGERAVQLTAYVCHLLQSLPRRNEWLFSSPTSASLTEWLETPSGVVAQIQCHKPSATAEQHYKLRPLDLLRVHHDRIEAWSL